MGVAITELLVKNEIDIKTLKGRVISVDAPNHLYQFLSTIRQPDGSLFTDANGSVTSHLIGLLSRTANLLKNGVRLVYVFDGKLPDLKQNEIKRRKIAKQDAAHKFAMAKQAGDELAMKKFASRTSSLTHEMIEEAKKLLDALGVPHVQAPCEGEAQAAHMAANRDCYAVSSQDADCLLFKAPKLIRNLSISGRKKSPGKLAYSFIGPEEFTLSENLSHLNIDQQQLISLSMLVGTDYNKAGIKGIGPRKALKIVKECKTPEKIFANVDWNSIQEVSWQEIYELIDNMPVTDDYKIKFKSSNPQKAIELLCDIHGFSKERVEKSISDIENSQRPEGQKGLFEF